MTSTTNTKSARDITTDDTVNYLGKARRVASAKRVRTCFPTSNSDTMEFTTEDGYTFTANLWTAIEVVA